MGFVFVRFEYEYDCFVLWQWAYQNYADIR